MYVGVVSANILYPPYRTPEDRPGEVLYLVHDAAAVTLSVESEGKQTGGLNALSIVSLIIGRGCPADLGSDLSDVAIASETGRVRLSRWCVLHVVLSGDPGKVARELRVD